MASGVAVSVLPLPLIQADIAAGRITGLMARPKLLLLDEPSLGLAPRRVREIARAIITINREDKVSVILVEQNSRMALRISSRAYVLETGRVALSDHRSSCSTTTASAASTSAADRARAVDIRRTPGRDWRGIKTKKVRGPDHAFDRPKIFPTALEH